MKNWWVVLFIAGILNSLNAFSQIETANLNSKFDERNPVISPDGKTLYFIRKFHPENMGGVKDPGDIWISLLENGKWSIPTNAGNPLNNKFFNGLIGFKDENSAYLHGRYTKDGSASKTQGISISQLQNGIWTQPVSVPIEYFQNRSDEEGISISRDGTIMVLSMESFGTYGEEDLYVSFLQPDGKWSQPKNLGYGLNTTAQEFTPYLAPDNITLYFASNGYEGFGSKDIFMTTRLDDTWQHWTEPRNLGGPVNSQGMELSFTPVSDELAYFISTQNSDGYGDIKMKKLNPELIKGLGVETAINSTVPKVDLSPLPEIKSANNQVAVFGSVLNQTNQQPVIANILATGSDFTNKFQTGEDGIFDLKLPKGNVYELVFSADGFLSRSEEVNLNSNEDLLEISIVLYPLTIGSTVNLEEVNFFRGTADFIESSFKQLKIVVQLLNDNPDMEIELSGHTDNQGDPKLNLKLSQDRVEKVKDYLVSKGLKADRISGRGYGGTRPIASNASELTRKLNRRVEFKIIRN